MSTRIVLGICLSISMVCPANAALVHFSDEATWLAAVGPLSAVEDFNGFASSVSFQPGDPPFQLNGFDVQAFGFNPIFGSAIEIMLGPVGIPELDIDGTNLLFLAIDNAGSGNELTIVLTFDAEVSAFGATFNDFGFPGSTEVELLDSSMSIVDTFAPPGTQGVLFWGFQATAGEEVAALRFRYLTVAPFQFDGFSVDNVGLLYANPVPEPSSIGLCAISGMLIGAAGILRRFRLR